jgi:hypothetical protein
MCRHLLGSGPAKQLKKMDSDCKSSSTMSSGGARTSNLRAQPQTREPSWRGEELVRGENEWNEERGGGSPPYIKGRGKWHLPGISLPNGGAHLGHRPLGETLGRPPPLLGPPTPLWAATWWPIRGCPFIK